MSSDNIPSTLVHSLTGHTGTVTSVHLNATGNYCCSAGTDKTIRLWNTVKGKHIYTFSNGHFSDILDAKLFFALSYLFLTLYSYAPTVTILIKLLHLAARISLY